MYLPPNRSLSGSNKTIKLTRLRRHHNIFYLKGRTEERTKLRLQHNIFYLTGRPKDGGRVSLGTMRNTLLIIFQTDGARHP